MASVLELACIYSALILHNKEVMALASVNTGDLTRKAEASGPEPAAGAPPEGGPAPSTPAAPGENKQAEAQKRI
ncbi:large ribosomal subunit protein P1-like [Capricornis sumatraensis]|uniref:large ribosomal subunit protein P1-like n=1 Tax=Capricornis sumatraensis TaxID=34865 RepID=UPI00360498A2